jgi:CDP-glucose 4,6-dehydratase
MTLWLSNLGADVTGYSLAPSTRPNFFTAMRAGDPEFVFHFAAQPLVRQAFAAPVDTFSTNVMGTVNVLQAMRGCDNLEAAIIFTTDKVYENTESGEDYREQDRLGGREPYGASKACSEIAVDAYRQSFFKEKFPIATVRAGNIIGGGDWSADRIVPDAIRSFSAGRPLRIRNPDAVRPWQHALDPARGLLILAEKMVSGDTVSPSLNFGPAADSAVTVGSLADTLTALWGNGAIWAAEKTAEAPYEARLLNLDSSLASSEIGWKTAWSLERALNATVDWYQGFLARKDMRALSLAQISAMEGAN